MKLIWQTSAVLAVMTIAIPIQGATVKPLSPQRIEQLAAMLPDAPQGMGRPITDRALWDALAKDKRLKYVVRDAEKLLHQPIIAVTDDQYLDYSRTGNRTRGQAVIKKRYERLGVLVKAECLENRGRFLPAIEETLRAYCTDKSWTLPAHDKNLETFSGKGMLIDLHSSQLSWEIATAYYWLGNKLSADVRKLVHEELNRRTFEPYFEEVLRKGHGAYWHKVVNNWNAVCTAGVVGAALATLESRHDRAVCVAAAERSMESYLSGFTADGYCSEGMGYWNYGFGHYVMLAEMLVQATGGKLDLLANKKAQAAATFGRNLEILPDVYPAFADCHPGTKPDEQISAFLSRRYGWGSKEIENRSLQPVQISRYSLPEFAVYAFSNTATRTPPAQATAAAAPLRSWFFEAGILICRPAAGKNGLGAALKGGNNNENHNHNDLGTFVVARGDQTPLLDPGSEIYTARTFSKKRYESNALNSFGHPVPIVAGKLQREGRDAQAKIVKTEFTDQADTLVFDLRSAYPVESLVKLQRTFVYSREGESSLKIIDEVEFSQPETFGIAMITYSLWHNNHDGQLTVGKDADAVRVEVRADMATPKFRVDEIKEDMGSKKTPIRLGFDLPSPVTKATITTLITPGK